ncbi:pitrilysin family protein [Synechocystis sp. LKSZ1]|uniref:M16 family metallopeptidase n=1 Tax=Synechocystis sp. LKSZ1 TaxID=3144951 RepID=UPI00336C01D8
MNFFCWRPCRWAGFFLVGLWFCLACPPWALAAPPSLTYAPYLQQVQDQITEFSLENGLKVIVLENHAAPVVSFFTYADVGGVDEPEGKTGVAHFLEHLAFKGTRRIGTQDYAAERKLLDQLDQLALQIRAARLQGEKPNPALQKQFEQVQAEAEKYVKPNEFSQIIQMAGGVGLNAATSADATMYFYSLPANKLELWMSLESERFLEPVFRGFYQEQQVILEERRMRTENNPMGRMVEAFLDQAFVKHPYKRPVIGYDADIRNLSRQDVTDFFEAYYGPANLTLVIVGDVDPQQVKTLAQRYFGRFPARPQPPTLTVVEPPQQQTRTITLRLPSQPWYLEGYHRPAMSHPDNAVYEVIATLMSDGRTSRLYQALVQDQQVALTAQGFNGFPGDKYPNLMLFYAQSTPNTDLTTLAQALGQEIERLKQEPVTPEELERVKNQLQADLLRSLDSNQGMARLLAEYEVKTGDWRNLFQQLEAVAAVTPADIQRVARQTFTPENRTIGRILPADTPN